MKNVQEIDPRSSIDNFLKKRSLEQKIVIKELGESHHVRVISFVHCHSHLKNNANLWLVQITI